MKWFLGLIIIWLPPAVLGFLAVKLDEMGIITPPSRDGKDIWPLLLAIFGGLGMTFLLNYGRRPGGFLDLWLDKILKRKSSIPRSMEDQLDIERNTESKKISKIKNDKL